ncbi:hypothetical protein PISMIDRAFT_690987 [Pisolithus microcarpus 441]|uniref:Uncharacterized protein n=1 Tax=Pisolithus microcarpus 441 TaxID=765257 RepID=A0A0C9XE32_9AGAM|nr:hypothetical protein PISMIDRAFT_690987 [Pisolithus microcarpus 441]
MQKCNSSQSYMVVIPSHYACLCPPLILWVQKLSNNSSIYDALLHLRWVGGLKPNF